MRTVHQPKADWRADAACANTDPDMFFPEVGQYTVSREAKRICATCTVTAQCGMWALENGEEHGIWGGMSPEEIRKLRAQRRAA